MLDPQVKTIHIRLKDRHSLALNAMSREVNFVWNYVNNLSYRSIRERCNWLSAYDMQKFTAGGTNFFNINSGTIDGVCAEYATRRKQFKKAKLRWRVSHGARRSLGWIPFKKTSIKAMADGIKYAGRIYKLKDRSYNLDDFELLAGNFAQDARGNWFINISVRFTPKPLRGKKSTGIDLGCKEAATDSNGNGVTGREYRKLEEKLGNAQRAGKKKQAKNIHAKIKNRRQDSLHKYSRKLVNENAAIFVGNVSSLGLAKTKMAKSVLDAGWGLLKTMIKYKCDHASTVFEEVNESYTTQTCSNCGCLPDSRPKGIAGLGIREWTCDECGVTHDRDINAAKNILALGMERLAGGNAESRKAGSMALSKKLGTSQNRVKRSIILQTDDN